jgi:UPF0148 protein
MFSRFSADIARHLTGPRRSTKLKHYWGLAIRVSSRDTSRLVVELMRRGATLLSESCPTCGGVMLRYRGVTFCPRCSGFTSVEEVESTLVAPGDLLENLEKVLYEGLRDDLRSLTGAKGHEERGALLRSLKEELEVLEIVLRLKELRSKSEG